MSLQSRITNTSSRQSSVRAPQNCEVVRGPQDSQAPNKMRVIRFKAILLVYKMTAKCQRLTAVSYTSRRCILPTLPTSRLRVISPTSSMVTSTTSNHLGKHRSSKSIRPTNRFRLSSAAEEQRTSRSHSSPSRASSLSWKEIPMCRGPLMSSRVAADCRVASFVLLAIAKDSSLTKDKRLAR